ncbi:hypothetical protein [Pseudonocardia acaciae]|uniref:hypothetical protein n=1 Tax=Pseudonocardia acaciae TaxID=551276 RepID=UPI001B80B7DE|nr:hypothetical protein [Pseudonocardia acaciae]
MTAAVGLMVLALLSGAGVATAAPIDDDADDTSGGSSYGSTYGPSHDPSYGPSRGPSYGPSRGPSYGPSRGTWAERPAPPSSTAPAPATPSQGDDGQRPSIKAQVKGAARPGETVRINTFCVSSPSALRASGPFTLESTSPGWGSFTTLGKVNRDARGGAVRVDMVCGGTTVSDSFSIKN